mmetsp:Transcript_43145/g.80272  ORF Transcript_43145/g.80272 Transcript_43145/m.80272 type:complete len:204 (-) Transcript_43145:367-978(-)
MRTAPNSKCRFTCPSMSKIGWLAMKCFGDRRRISAWPHGEREKALLRSLDVAQRELRSSCHTSTSGSPSTFGNSCFGLRCLLLVTSVVEPRALRFAIRSLLALLSEDSASEAASASGTPPTKSCTLARARCTQALSGRRGARSPCEDSASERSTPRFWVSAAGLFAAGAGPSDSPSESAKAHSAAAGGIFCSVSEATGVDGGP